MGSRLTNAAPVAGEDKVLGETGLNWLLTGIAADA